MFTKQFWKDAAERVISTAAEVAIPTFAGASAWDIDYGVASGITLSAAVVAFLKAIVATRVGNPDSAAALPSPSEPTVR